MHQQSITLWFLKTSRAFISSLLLVNLLGLAQSSAQELNYDNLLMSQIWNAIDQSRTASLPDQSCELTPVHGPGLPSAQRRPLVPTNNDLGERVHLSLLSEKEAKDLHRFIANQEHIPHDFIEDGCWERALETIRILHSLNITAGIYQIDGPLIVDSPESPTGEWEFTNFHVAVIVKVQVTDETGNSRVENWILDPTLSPEPQSLDDWRKALTRRQVYGAPVNRSEGLIPNSSVPNHERLELAHQTLRVYREQQKHLAELRRKAREQRESR